MLGDEGVISIDIGLASDTSSTSTGVTSSFTPASGMLTVMPCREDADSWLLPDESGGEGES